MCLQLETLLSVVQAQMNAQAGLTARVRRKMVGGAFILAL